MMEHMDTALVGYTGFVGQTLSHQLDFDALYNSSNSAEMAGKTYGQVMFSAARAEKWRANADPIADAAHIDTLIDLIHSFEAEVFVLISTVDVYQSPRGVDEHSPVYREGDWHAYGKNRFRLEEAVRRRFPSALIIRLPALFGEGLKKNALYDFMNDNNVDRVNPDGELQFYNMEYLSRDILRGQELGAELLNVCSAPLRLADVAREVFGLDISRNPAQNPARYDVRSIHSSHWGDFDYLYSKQSIMQDLAGYVATQSTS